MELKLGKMSNKELAQWFGVTEKYFTNKKEKKLVELEKYYAKFQKIRGGVEITEILVSEYDPKLKTTYTEILNSVDETWSDNNLDTCINAGRKIKNKLNLDLKDKTIGDYVRKARTDLYGKPSVEPIKMEQKGSLGRCKYVWCKKEDLGRTDKICQYRFLSEEEENIKKKLLNKYYGSDKANREARSMADSLLKKGSIKKTEYYDTLNQLTGTKENAFELFISELRDAIGGIIVRGTLIERDNEGYFFIESGTDIEAPIE